MFRRKIAFRVNVGWSPIRPQSSVYSLSVVREDQVRLRNGGDGSILSGCAVALLVLFPRAARARVVAPHFRAGSNWLRCCFRLPLGGLKLPMPLLALIY